MIYANRLSPIRQSESLTLLTVRNKHTYLSKAHVIIHHADDGHLKYFYTAKIKKENQACNDNILTLFISILKKQ